jgi:hypothetical protein
VLCFGAWFYVRHANGGLPGGAANIRTTVDIAGVRNDLLAIANAERSQFALEGKYLPLDALQSKGIINLPASGRGGYKYSVYIGETGFRVIASYSSAAGPAPQTISIDERMEIRTE